MQPKVTMPSSKNWLANPPALNCCGLWSSSDMSWSGICVPADHPTSVSTLTNTPVTWINSSQQSQMFSVPSQNSWSHLFQQIGSNLTYERLWFQKKFLMCLQTFGHIGLFSKTQTKLSLRLNCSASNKSLLESLFYLGPNVSSNILSEVWGCQWWTDKWLLSPFESPCWYKKYFIMSVQQSFGKLNRLNEINGKWEG